jgi:tRNA(His) guanylyltransferase
MEFDDLDAQMRIFETLNDQYVLPSIFMVARVDGRSFTHLTKDVHKFKTPFDERMRDYMVGTADHLMQCGFRILYAYTQSDEISLLFHPQEDAFGRKLRKLNSILAGEASAQMTLLLGDLAAFDSRISQLPQEKNVVDYFRWRQEDAHRNALNAHCYWLLRDRGETAADATSYLARLSVADKNELLFQAGVNFNDLPNWQKRGVGLYWETYEKPAFNPLTGQDVMASRRRLKVDYELPLKEDYSRFILDFLAETD